MADKYRTITRINGVEYNIVSPHSEEYVHKITSYLNRVTTETASTNPKLSNNMINVLTAMNIADEYFKACQDADKLRREVQNYIEDCGKLRAEKDAVMKNLEAARRLDQERQAEIHRLQIELARKETELKDFVNAFDTSR